MADLPARPDLDHLRREARNTDLARQAEVFCEASIRDWTGRAARMLAANPELAGYSFATAVVLGDADRVRVEIAQDPGLATRVDARTGWTALHAACASRWNRLEPARAGGLAAVARLLLDAAADPVGRVPGRRGRGRPVSPRPWRQPRGTRRDLGQLPAGLGHRGQRRTARYQPSSRLDRHRPGPARRRSFHRRHHALAR
jgi:hypothetical protein